MRALAACAAVLGLIVSPAITRAGRPGDKDSAANATPASAADAAAKAAPSSMEVESDLRQMRDLLEAQARQLQEQQQRMNQLEEQLKASQPGLISESPAAAPANSASEPVAAVGPVGPATGVVAASQASQEKNPDEPTSLHFKGITLTPGGYMAAESVWRQHSLSADVNTPFNSIPFAGSPMAHTTEFNASGRQSRIAMLAEGKLSGVKIGGYYEADFLSAGVTSNYNESNSFTLRQRQFWGQAAFASGWTVTGGQMWSLMTETKKGMDNRTEAVPLTIDAQYHVGFGWARQYGFRLTKNFSNKFWLGASVENAETTTAFHGQNNDFLVGAPGSGGGLLNPIANFAFTKAPDFIVKAVVEPGWGHYEIFGVVSTFRDRIYPCGGTAAGVACGGLIGPSGAGAFNDTRVGGGVGANARVTVLKKIDLGIHFMGGDGIGRYGAGSLPDVTVRPDGTLALIRSFQSLGTIELRATPKLDVYMYVGGEYAARTQFLKGGTFSEGYGAIALPNFGCSVEQAPGSAVSTPTGVGGSGGFVPGSLASCTGDTRNVIEGTFGFWYRFYKGSKGTVQWGPQYSYLRRNTWNGVGTGSVNGLTVTTNGAPHGVENMVFTSFRYVLP